MRLMKIRTTAKKLIPNTGVLMDMGIYLFI